MLAILVGQASYNYTNLNQACQRHVACRPWIWHDGNRGNCEEWLLQVISYGLVYHRLGFLGDRHSNGDMSRKFSGGALGKSTAKVKRRMGWRKILNSGAEMASQNCPKLRQGAGLLYPFHWPVIGCGLPWGWGITLSEAAPFKQRQFARRDTALEPPAANTPSSVSTPWPQCLGQLQHPLTLAGLIFEESH